MMHGNEPPQPRDHDAPSTIPVNTPISLDGERSSPLATNQQQAAKLLNKRMRIRVKDGRILVGDFICLDKQGNIILNHAIERYEENGKTEEKLLGQVLVPATQRETCDIETVTSDLEAIHAVLASPTAV